MCPLVSIKFMALNNFKFAALTSIHKHMLNLFTRRAVLTYLSLLRVSSLTDIQWVKKLAVLTGWPYYWGRVKVHDLRAVTTNTPYIAFPFLEQLFSLTNTRNVNSRTVIVKTT